jgi:hypothetical protein
MYLCRVARSKKPSEAARQLVRELAERGLTVGYRAIEDWAARGLAPAPVRRSLGRGRGTASEYPAGASDQYAAVASVMRPGLPWQVSVLKLLVRGHLPANHDLVRQALRELLAPDPAEPGADALDRAERMAARTAGTRAGRSFLRAFERNLRSCAPPLEPAAEVSSVAAGALATLFMAAAGEPAWSTEALAEMMAALGFPVAEMTDEDRQGLAGFAGIFVTEVFSGPLLAAAVGQVPLSRIMRAVPLARETVTEALRDPGRGLPPLNEDFSDLLTVCAALVLIRIEDLGGHQAMAKLAGRARSPAELPADQLLALILTGRVPVPARPADQAQRNRAHPSLPCLPLRHP